MKSSYVIITPLRNEIDNLKNLVCSVIRQTVKPKIWLIINDGSTDGSTEFLNDISSQVPFIKVIDYENSSRDMLIHYSELIKFGIDSISKMQKFDFLGILDADIIVPNDYYCKVILFFNRNKQAGIISGPILISSKGKYFSEGVNFGKNNFLVQNKPRGGNRVWRQSCLSETGFQISIGSNGISLALAEINGWSLHNLANLICFQTRETASFGGKWKSYKVVAARAYYLHRPLVQVFFRFLYYTLQWPPHNSLSYMFTYFKHLVAEKERLKNDILVSYFKNDNFKKMVKSTLDNLR